MDTAPFFFGAFFEFFLVRLFFMDELRGFLRQLHIRANSIPNGEKITKRDLEEGCEITRRSFSNFSLHREASLIDDTLSSALCLWNTCVRIGSRPNIPNEELLSEIFAREIVCEVVGSVNSCQRDPEREITLVTFLGILASRWFICGEEYLDNVRNTCEKAIVYIKIHNGNDKQVLDQKMCQASVAIFSLELKRITKTLQIDSFMEIKRPIFSMCQKLSHEQVEVICTLIFNSALAFYKVENYDGAISSLEFATTIFESISLEAPKLQPIILRLLARCHLLLKNYDEALKHATTANKIASSPRLLYLLCTIHCELEEKDLAFENAMALHRHENPDHELCLQSIDRMIERKWYSEALQFAEGMSEMLDPEDPVSFNIKSKVMQRQIGANLYLEEETWDMMQDSENEQEIPQYNQKALTLADEWIDLTKNRSLSIESLSRRLLISEIQCHAVKLFKRGYFEKCKEWLFKASNVDEQGGGNQAHLSRLIGRCYYEIYKAGDKMEGVDISPNLTSALKYARKSEYLDSTNPSTSYLLILIHFEQEDTLEATRQVSKMIEIAKNSEIGEDPVTFLEAIVEDAVEKKMYGIAKQVLEPLLFSPNMNQMNPLQFGKVFVSLIQIVAQEKEKINDFDFDSQKAALLDISRLLELGTKKMEQGGRDWFENEKDLVYLQDYSWNLGLESSRRKLPLQAHFFFERSLQFLHFRDPKDRDQVMEEKTSLLSIAAALDHVIETKDLQTAERALKRVSCLRSQLTDTSESHEKEVNQTRSTLLVAEIVAKTVLNNSSSVTTLVQSIRILNFVSIEDLKRLAVFFFNHKFVDKWKELATSLLVLSIEKMQNESPVPWQSIGESLYFLVCLEDNCQQNIDQFHEFLEIIKDHKENVDSSLIQWFIVTAFNCGQKLACEGSMQMSSLQEAEAWISCAMALNNHYKYKENYEDTINATYGKALDSLNRSSLSGKRKE